MAFEDTAANQQSIALEGKTPKDLLEFAKEVGYELSDEELEQVSAGNEWVDELKCPKCGSTDVSWGPFDVPKCSCNACRWKFN